MNKKTGFFATAAFMALTACQNNTGYTIEGTIAEIADGQYVYLMNTDQKATVLDSAKVENGRFQFKGEPETGIFPKTLMYEADDSRMGILLFLEKGKIRADLQKNNSTAGGTLNNDALYAFLNEYRKMEQEKGELYRSIYTFSGSEAQLQEMWTEYDRKESALQEYIFNQMSANIEQPFGMYLLVSFGMQFDAEKLNELLPGIPAEMSSNEAIRQIKGYVGNRLNTAAGKKYIDLPMQTPEGKEVRISDYIGKERYVLLHYWASWCNPCCAEMPGMIGIYQKYRSEGFGMVGISLDQNAEEWKSAIKELNITWPQLSDLQAWSSPAAIRYGIIGIPATVLIDQEGKIIARDLRGSELEDKMEELFK